MIIKGGVIFISILCNLPSHITIQQIKASEQMLNTYLGKNDIGWLNI